MAAIVGASVTRTGATDAYPPAGRGGGSGGGGGSAPLAVPLAAADLVTVDLRAARARARRGVRTVVVRLIAARTEGPHTTFSSEGGVFPIGSQIELPSLILEIALNASMSGRNLRGTLPLVTSLW